MNKSPGIDDDDDCCCFLLHWLILIEKYITIATFDMRYFKFLEYLISLKQILQQLSTLNTEMYKVLKANLKVKF